MLDKWKNKIKKLFSDDLEEAPQERKPPKVEKKKQSLEAKVTYQYPKQRPFRFPVIPDEPTQYNQKGRGKGKRKDEHKPPHNESSNNESLKAKPEKKKKEERQEEKVSTSKGVPSADKKKIYKQSDEPFRVSEVPSPIFGFQKRDKQEEKNKSMPAVDDSNKDYNNKKETSYETNHEHRVELESYNEIANTVEIEEVEESSLNQVELGSTETEEDLIQKHVTEMEPENVHRNDVMNEFENEDKETSNLEPKESELEGNSNDVDPAQQLEEELSMPEQQVNENEDKHEILTEEEMELKSEQKENNAENQDGRKEEPTQKNKTQKETLSENKEEKPYVFPFNVIMTPSDKRNLQRRKKENQIQKKQTIKDTSDNKTTDAVDEVKETQGNEISSETSEVLEDVERKDIYIPYHLLDDPSPINNDDRKWVEEQQALLEQTLKYFKVRAEVVKATKGPSVTRFEVHPELGVKVSKIKNLSDDLKLNMAAKDIRIEAPIPGKNTVGIEIPNEKAQTVGLQEIFETEAFKENESPLTIALGLSIEGEPKITNIQKMPHGLIAGATGSGKSVCINTMLVSLLYKAHHDDVKILLIDPKMVELAPYNGIPHLVAPVITDVKAATQSLKWAVNEMEDRYERFVQEGVRNIEGYNKKVKQQGHFSKKMPFIVIVIDELADLMMTSPQDVEDSISRIAQKARACGIHLILATQRPSVDVITGLIKANIPTRIAFSVSSQVDSRTIIDTSGAEKLLGKGDMLFVENGAGKSIRLQGPFVSDDEIERITNYARSIAEPDYLFEQEELLEQVHIDEEEDELLQEVIEFVVSQNSASTSMIQRRFKIGYNRAARLMDTLEYRGIISGQNGSKPRDVLISQKQEDL
ncbi:DNA translocase FtsK [Oceanobacillus senegalensis]|uniref:DNA translocase FtsK n=1 Tax=Oceanobacillus senegalensis TaxID=1936063 RepID=UPI000A30B17E|nr:DNA translocase FtsK [Oceanobacillus senegalensis]